MPPHHIVTGAFDEAFAQRLLTYALENEERFEPGQVVDREGRDVVNDKMRVSLILQELGSLKQEIREQLRELGPRLFAPLGIAPFDLTKIEVEMAAHNDGAFFINHADTIQDDPDAARVVSVVYYFHRRPRAYDGGALRLYGPAQEGEPGFQDVVPDHNMLVAFPSFLPHEVMPVACPSRRFADSRFAVNAWLRRR